MFSIDKKFKNNKGHYIFQCAIVSICLSVIFSMLDFVFETALVAALGATAFIVFTCPFREVSRSRYIIGGYCIGTIVGVGIAYVFQITGMGQHFFGFWAALSVGITMFLMVVFDFEHPPAAGVALGLLTNGSHLHSIVAAFIGIFSILLLRRLLLKVLMDLL